MKTSLASSLTRGPDLELHVRTIEVDGEELLDIREYVPSAENYGRGVTVPASLRKQLIAALKEAT